jgi:hypothetical protein
MQYKILGISPKVTGSFVRLLLDFLIISCEIILQLRKEQSIGHGRIHLWGSYLRLAHKYASKDAVFSKRRPLSASNSAESVYT